MSKPLIGLLPYHDTATNDIYMRSAYTRAITAAGGIPVVLPLEISEQDLKQLVDTLDGFLFTGGPDVHSFLFGEETHPKCRNISPLRDTLEMDILPIIMEQEKPVFGVCRGIQILNIALGGTIYQDIESQFSSEIPVAHDQTFDFKIPCHTVDVFPGTLLSEITGESSLMVNSMHHQAIKDLAPCLETCACASGHLVEAVEYPGYPFFLAVQWHPEHLWTKQPEERALFEAFVRACI
ncbi:gamma-glutamyl-gamma-aminobutyrate hydrolase family protein [Clostridium sp. AM58-1XD]|uniref:gamma-glutamyl-gamma-aminobutyrate hydrolase family protein n=1 Tax=Clostridium sp. AM58-1XD TaxID=2292307 RepID=UPI000E46F66B|nr:gamma-glutamyl-gamma-aminobutyrate hydrolase family protein [Clostridium sp. AM58-1XD]RGZ01237.1 gamma-glutamyl-gamma-aminobutyrate hydrolase family protein [Clostridium sp. AM58-1XD]